MGVALTNYRMIRGHKHEAALTDLMHPLCESRDGNSVSYETGDDMAGAEGVEAATHSPKDSGTCSPGTSWRCEREEEQISQQPDSERGVGSGFEAMNSQFVCKADIVRLEVLDARGLAVGQHCEREERRGLERKYDKKRRAKQTGVIYKIRCKRSGKAYIGQTRRFPWRMKEHERSGRKTYRWC